jgi:recombination protein RecR
VAHGQASPYLGGMASSEIEALTQALSRLPGLGPRSARRAVLHLVKKRQTALDPLLAALERVAQRLVTCSTCGNVDTADPCAVCADPRRDDRALCVVEEVADLWALERSRLFPGRFHVLGGRLSALEGVRPEDLAIDGLVARVEAGGVDEVVLAMNATLEGQTTANGSSAFPCASPSLPTACRSAASWTTWTKARWRKPCAHADRSASPAHRPQRSKATKARKRQLCPDPDHQHRLR